MGAKVVSDGLNQFLDDYPGMSTAPYSDFGLCLRGIFRFKAGVSDGEKIEDCYKLEIIVPGKFPRALPKVKEIGDKIPKDGNFHINPDGTLCLGSPLSLLKKIYIFQNLNGFINKCLVPYLYAVSLKLRNGGSFVFGELAHGDQGIVDDYSELLGLTNRSQIAQAFHLLGVKKRVANKRPCPCGCRKKLGACSFHHKMNAFRKMASVSWFKTHALNDL